jgi:hypothetical protein
MADLLAVELRINIYQFSNIVNRLNCSGKIGKQKDMMHILGKGKKEISS